MSHAPEYGSFQPYGAWEKSLRWVEVKGMCFLEQSPYCPSVRGSQGDASVQGVVMKWTSWSIVDNFIFVYGISWW